MPEHGATGADVPDWGLERVLWARGFTPVAGVDEAGRGALAGPVVAAAVILPLGAYPYRDSKELTAVRREELAAHVRGCAVAWAVGFATPGEVDRLNVLRASLLAARRAVLGLRLRPAALVTDYLRTECGMPAHAVVRGDGRSLQVAAASILAKTTRDAVMRELAERFPGYGFERHKGYGAPAHLRALHDLGPCGEHRRTFAPVARRPLFPA